jgi:hypothetical protein
MLIETNWLNMLVDMGENKGYVIQADQIRFGNHIPGHLGIVFIEGDILFNGVTAHSGPRPHHYRGFTITDTPHSVGLLWTSDQPYAETATYTTHYTHKKTDIHPTGGIRTRNPSKPAVADPRLRPCGLWVRRRSR